MAQTLFDLLADPEAAAFLPPFAKDLRKKPKNIDVLNAGIAGVGDLAYDVAGFPVDMSTALMRALGVQTGQTPFGSDWLKQKATNAGIRPPESADPTLRDVRLGAEMMAGGIDPFATARGIGVVGSKVAKELEPTLINALDTYAQKAGLQPSILPPDAAKKVMGQTKIVDESGMPEVYYRGAKSKYDPLSSAGANEASKSGDTGLWLAKSPDLASSYTGSQGLGHVSPAYPDVRNPLVIDAGKNLWSEIPSKAVEDVLGVKLSSPTVTTDQVARIAKERGFDGVQFKNVIDVKGGRMATEASMQPTDVVVAFNPKNVRSALSDKAIAGAARVPPRPKAPVKQAVQAPTIEAPVSPAGFYSAAEQAALNMTKTKGTGQSLIDELMKAPNVKKDELEYTGLIDAFSNKKQATKQELIDYLQANRTNVGETRLGEAGSFEARNIAALDIEDTLKAGGMFDDDAKYALEAWKNAEPNSRSASQNQVLLEEKLIYAGENRTVNEFLDAGSAQTDSTKYGKYTLPGGENYREVLLTLPNKGDALYAKAERLMAKGRDGTATDADRAEWASIMNQLQPETRDIEGISRFRGMPDYKSGHWDEPNVFAHLRLNDRIDADGKKMTLIEEVQSDWHQAGREKGYRRSNKDRIPTKFEQDDSGWNIFDQDGNEITYVTNAVNPSGTKEGAIKVAQERLKADEFLVRSKTVPDAPMKDTWYQTALRKAVKDAIDQGSDRVGILTGARQAERYDLSKQVDEIAVPMINKDGSRSVRIDPTQGSSIKLMVDKNGVVTGYGSGSTQFSGKKLDEVIGKEMADKVMKADAKARFSDVDLKVGGEGMKKYYDEIYPKYLDKFAKKYGSSIKEGQINLNKDLEGFMPRKDMKVETVRYIEITPEMRKAFGGKDKGVPLFQMAPAIPAGAIGAGGLLDQFGERQQ